MTPKNKSVIRMIEVEEEAIFLNTLNKPALTWSSGDYYFQRTGSQKTSYHVQSTYVGVSYQLLDIYFFYIFIQRYTFYLLIFLWTENKLIVNLELREKFTP